MEDNSNLDKFKIHKYRGFRQLLKDFNTNGKKTQARQEIHTRLAYLSYIEQIKILHLFLDGCSGDRRWALSFLTAHWDNSFLHDVKLLFEKYQEKEAAKVLCLYAESAYIEEHAEELAKAYYYSYVRMRLPKDSPIDKERMSPGSFLYLLVKQGIQVSDDEMGEAFYTALWQALPTIDARMPVSGEYRSPLDSVKTSVWCIGELKQTKLLREIADFEEQCRKQFDGKWKAHPKKILIEYLKDKPYYKKFLKLLCEERISTAPQCNDCPYRDECLTRLEMESSNSASFSS